MIEQEVDVTTPDGEMKTFIYHPSHEGPHPVVLYLMDAPSIRPALKEMASRLATAGYFVMLPYLFYRGGPYREFGRSDEEMHLWRELMRGVTTTSILGDADALLALADADPAAREGAVGAVGFCMSGPLVFSLAKNRPERVKAAASIHGARLVTDDPESPHRGLERVQGEIYLGWADNDQSAPPETVPVMRQALDDAGVRYELDFFTDAVHGYAPPGERYNRAASELHWERVHAMLRRNVA